MMTAVITVSPASAVAWMSIMWKRSSRPWPRARGMVSLRPPIKGSAPAPARMANETSPLSSRESSRGSGGSGKGPLAPYLDDAEQPPA